MTSPNEKAVLLDGLSGEPVAWFREGDSVIGSGFDPTEWDYTPYTRQLTPEEAAATYGAVTELIVGPRGGFRQVAYGTTKFLFRPLDPRGSTLRLPETSVEQ